MWAKKSYLDRKLLSFKAKYSFRSNLWRDLRIHVIIQGEAIISWKCESRRLDFICSSHLPVFSTILLLKQM